MCHQASGCPQPQRWAEGHKSRERACEALRPLPDHRTPFHIASGGPAAGLQLCVDSGHEGKYKWRKTKPNNPPEETGLIRVRPQPLTARVNAMCSRENKTQSVVPGTGASC